MIYSNLITDLNAAVEVIRNVIIYLFLRLNDFLASTAKMGIWTLSLSR